MFTHEPTPPTEALHDAGLGDLPLGDVGFWNFTTISLISGGGSLPAFVGVLILILPR